MDYHMAEGSLSTMAQGLTTRLIGHPVLYYFSVSSTQDVAKEAARLGAEEGTVVIAEEQTAGRGRLERAWISSRGNLSLSVVLRPPLRLL
ncbi:MAG: biotin--[acetyl-CoA-carboxylase] ligase, partial [Chloroflexota bacterium]